MGVSKSKRPIAAPSYQGDGSALTFGKVTFQCDEILLTAAQILTLHSVPVSLVAAPGAGKLILVDKLLFQMTATATAFANGGVVAPVYHGATTALTADTIPASVVNAGAGTTYTALEVGAPANGETLTANAGIDLYAATADFIIGTGTAKVKIWYSVVTL